MAKKNNTSHRYIRGYKVVNDQGHWMIYDAANHFIRSCDTDELYHMIDEIEAESED